jgi:putative mRNA 3-end processing factor
MFHYDRGLKITALDLAVDFSRRQPRGFISHAHFDHMAAHELAFCTPATAALYQQRLGERRVRLMPFGEPLLWNGMELSTHPAGHVFGSAMLLVNDGSQRLLYTGDFKLRNSLTAEPAKPPRADVLVMESTYGDPRYRLPSRAESCERLVSVVRQALEQGRVPVIQAYLLGKAQEVTRILTSAGLRVLQHPVIYPISERYRACGCELGAFELFSLERLPGSVVILPPRWQKAASLPGLKNALRIIVTGWAINEVTRQRQLADVAIPLSDHADYDELLECVDLVQPSQVYCTHGPTAFVERLRQRGVEAYALSGGRQPMAASLLAGPAC